MTEEQREKLIRQGKLTDKWGRKIGEDNNNVIDINTNVRLYTPSEVLKVILITSLATYLFAKYQNEIEYLLKYILYV